MYELRDVFLQQGCHLHLVVRSNIKSVRKQRGKAKDALKHASTQISWAISSLIHCCYIPLGQLAPFSMPKEYRGRLGAEVNIRTPVVSKLSLSWWNSQFPFPSAIYFSFLLLLHSLLIIFFISFSLLAFCITYLLHKFKHCWKPAIFLICLQDCNLGMAKLIYFLSLIVANLGCLYLL